MKHGHWTPAKKHLEYLPEPTSLRPTESARDEGAALPVKTQRA